MSIAEVPSSQIGIPVLQAGDRLSRAEFEHRYEAMPSGKKAELLKGTVYMPSPVRIGHHARPHSIFSIWLGHYELATPGVEMADNGTVRLGPEDEPQPDLMLRLLPECGGQSSVDEDDFVVGPPELVIEVSSSSKSYDLGVKLEVYQEQGVPEYVVWRVEEGAVDWRVRRGNSYELMLRPEDGVLRSEQFPGLWLEVDALLNRDLPRLIAVLQQGLATEDHTRFVKRLADLKAAG